MYITSTRIYYDEFTQKTYLEAKLLFVSTMETLQKLYSAQAAIALAEDTLLLLILPGLSGSTTTCGVELSSSQFFGEPQRLLPEETI